MEKRLAYSTVGMASWKKGAVIPVSHGTYTIEWSHHHQMYVILDPEGRQTTDKPCQFKEHLMQKCRILNEARDKVITRAAGRVS